MVCDNVMRHMNFQEEHAFSTLRLAGSRIKRYSKSGSIVYTTAIHARGGHTGTMKRVALLCEEFSGTVLVMDKNIPVSACREANVHTNRKVIVVKSIADIVNNLPPAIHLDGAQKVLLRQTLFERRRRLTFESSNDTPQARRQAYADRMVDNYQQGTLMMDPPPQELWETQGVFMHQPTFIMFPTGNPQNTEDEEFTRAQDLSMEHHRVEQIRRHAQPRQLPAEWPSILKQAQLAQSGDCVCLTCADMAATVCFVPCGHQVMCDDCVRKMWAMPGVDRKCPMCSQTPLSIVRPVTTERK